MSETNTHNDATFESWAILELMGHRRLGGFVQEVELAGSAFLRIDIPQREGEGMLATQFYSGNAVYCLTPTTEEAARAVASSNQPRPVHYYELPSPRTIDIPENDNIEDPPY